MNEEQILYSINVADVLAIAEDSFDIEVSESDLEFIENKIGNYIDWRAAIEFALFELEAQKRIKYD